MSTTHFEGLETTQHVQVVEMPCCGFAFDAAHKDTAGGYTCPCCEAEDLGAQNARLREALKLIAHHAMDTLQETTISRQTAISRQLRGMLDYCASKARVALTEGET